MSGKIPNCDPHILACFHCIRSTPFSIVTSFQLQKDKVCKSFFQLQCEVLPNPHLYFSSFWLHLAVAAATSERQMMYASERGMNNTVEIGEGNLKLVYSGNDARQAEYINSRS